MASRETLDQWADTLDAIGELYCHVIDTVADLPEQKVDLAGSSSIGKPPPLPGGMKLVLAGPHNLHAPPDDVAHPGVFLERWCVHVGHRSRALPPARTRALDLWQARLLWLRERLQWIDAEDTFAEELRAVHGLLRNACNADRASQAEQVADRWLRGEAAMRELQERWRDIPWAYMLDREDIENIWPGRLSEDHYHAMRQWKIDNPNEPVPVGHFPAGLVRQYLQ